MEGDKDGVLGQRAYLVHSIICGSDDSQSDGLLSLSLMQVSAFHSLCHIVKF